MNAARFLKHIFRSSRVLQRKEFAMAVCLLAAIFVSLATSGICLATVAQRTTIKEDVIAQHMRNYEAFLSLRSLKSEAPENALALRPFIEQHDIFENILEAQLADVKPIALGVAAKLIDVELYCSVWEELVVYYVAIQYRVKEETNYYYNGMNYRLYVLGLENGRWLIVQVSEAPVHEIREAGYGFNTLPERTALSIQKERLRKSTFVTPKKELTKDPRPLVGGYQCPSTIRVWRRGLGLVETIDFCDYVKGVLPNEWIASWGMQSLYAGSLACKMYGWYHIIYPKHPSIGANVCDSTCCQVYDPTKSDWRTDQAVDDLAGIGVARADGQLFETEYIDGRAVVSASTLKIRSGPGTSEPQIGVLYQGDNVCILSNGVTFQDGYHWFFITDCLCDVSNYSGYTKGWVAGEYLVSYWNGNPMTAYLDRLTQWGSKYWADQSKDYSFILHYFYDGTPRTSGQDIEFFSCSTAQPDLTVEDIWIDPAEFAPSDTVDLCVRIKNMGDAPAGGFVLKRYLDGGYVASSYGIEGLGAGYSTTLPTSWELAWPSNCSSHTIKVVIDANGDVPESDEGNNERSETFSATEDTTDPFEVSYLHSTSHSLSTWSNDNTIDVAWTAATDAQSGVDGYSILWDHSSSTLPNASKDIEEVTSTTSSPLANGTWYFHIRTVDNAGNWDNTAADLGPFYIDTSRPTCSLSINNGDASTNSLTATLNLSASDTGGSGLYQMHFSNNGSTWSSWESYNSTKSNWDLSSYGGNSNPGTKTAYAKVKDHAGNIVASPCSDTINYSPACTYNISPSTQAFNYSGGSDTVTVTTQSGCSWIAQSNENWIHVTSGGSSTGTGTVYYSVDGNSSTSSRLGTMTIAGKTFTVNQDGAAWITITVPNGGEIGKVGDTEPVMWDAHNAGNNVELEYSTDEGSSWKNIINSTANDGEYSWTIPNDPSTQCRVKVISISYPSVFDISNDNFTIYLDTAAVFRVESTGDVLADGSFYGQNFLAGSADVAEWVPVSEPVEPGDVLELDPENPGQYRKARGPCSNLVAGVVSTEPGFVLGTSPATEDSGLPTPDRALLALIGIVPVKVTNEGGPIQPGDLLVTSFTPGHAMRWDPDDGSPCNLVGKALEPLEGGNGIILVLLTAH